MTMRNPVTGTEIAGLLVLGAAIVGVVVAAKSSSAAQTVAPTSAPMPVPVPSPSTPVPTSGPASSTLPAGPYTRLSVGAKMLKGGTYLASASPGAATPLTTALTELQGAGFTILGSWSSAPDGWPPGDPFPTGAHIAVTNGSTQDQPSGQDVAVWATGGATS